LGREYGDVRVLSVVDAMLIAIRGNLKHGGPGGKQVCLAEVLSNQMEL
jgi:hypothetical protein